MHKEPVQRMKTDYQQCTSYVNDVIVTSSSHIAALGHCITRRKVEGLQHMQRNAWKLLLRVEQLQTITHVSAEMHNLKSFSIATSSGYVLSSEEIRL